jgi:hypothetical protein
MKSDLGQSWTAERKKMMQKEQNHEEIRYRPSETPIVLLSGHEQGTCLQG